MRKALLLAWFLTYPCWYGPDEKPISILAGPFTTITKCKKFQEGMGIFIGPLVWSETSCEEVTAWPRPNTCPDDTKEE
jgi:hypothetical protein